MAVSSLEGICYWCTKALSAFEIRILGKVLLVTDAILKAVNRI